MVARTRGRKGGTYLAKASAPVWVLSYGDMVTLLLCFFVALFAFSNVDTAKFELAVISIRDAFGLLEGGRATTKPRLPTKLDKINQELVEELRELERTKQRVQEYIRAKDLEKSVSVEMEERGLVLRFLDQVLFDIGQAELKPQAVGILDEVAAIVAALPNQVRVEGHTCDLPINTLRFPSNWELSTARACAVVKYMVSKHDLSPKRLSAAGYGEYRPIAPNDSEKNRARNRRVDVVILRSSFAAVEPR